ncbi:MAG: Pantothenate synthetase [Bacteroidia bacterium]|nr:Pantothenate synthetase [Bacteroidia bacterium]
MIVFEKATELNQFLAREREKGKTVGFVPTMGALHNGHISLINKARNENSMVVASVFVNPTQFNNAEDLKKYPRTIEADKALLEENGCDVLFFPSVEEIYPEKDNTVFDLGGLDTLMEGKFRPGHFNGVAMVVKRLFQIVQPEHAYFGEKDFQQLAIIRYMVSSEKLPVNIISCPTLRESSGLAMSSRNMRLTKEEKVEAAAIYRALLEAKENAKTLQPHEVKEIFEQSISQNSAFKFEYFEIVDSENLLPVKEWNPQRKATGCVAVWIRDVRLIDNLLIFP